jgi:hypothetical protein
MSARQKTFLLGLVTFALLACTAQPNPPPASAAGTVTPPAPALPTPMDVLGVTIGEPLKLPRCAKREDFDTKISCWRKNYGDQQQSKTVPSDAALDVYFADSDVPGGIYGSADVVVTDGKVLDISLSTMDFEQESIYKLLEAKWGKPYQANIANLQNGFGAQFQSIEAQWVFPKLRILFLGRATSDSGSITFQSLPRPKSNGPQQPTSL